MSLELKIEIRIWDLKSKPSLYSSWWYLHFCNGRSIFSFIKHSLTNIINCFSLVLLWFTLNSLRSNYCISIHFLDFFLWIFIAFYFLLILVVQWLLEWNIRRHKIVLNCMFTMHVYCIRIMNLLLSIRGNQN